jgi:hypothetical protein
VFRSLVSLFSVVFMGLLCSCGQDSQSAKTPQSPPVAPPPTAKPDVKEKADEWTSLFDGKSFGKWKPTDFGGAAEPKIEDGAFILPVGDTLSGVTHSGEGVPKINYEISLDAKRIDGSDFFCGLTFPVKDKNASLILGGWGGAVCGISSLDGEDASSNSTTKAIGFQNNRWYNVRMRVLENRLQAWLDEEQIVDVDTTGKDIGIRIEVSESCPLGLATYQTTGAIKNIRFRKIEPDKKSQ